jgi:hypothetical protein
LLLCTPSLVRQAARVGSICAPQVLQFYSAANVSFTFGFACLLAMCGTLLLPDTRSFSMPETLDGFRSSLKSRSSVEDLRGLEQDASEAGSPSNRFQKAAAAYVEA